MQHDPFGRIAGPPTRALSRADKRSLDDADRAVRVELLARATRSLLAGEVPDPEARLFIAGALSAWLAQGGDLERDFLRVRAPRGSQLTAARLWNAIGAEEI